MNQCTVNTLGHLIVAEHRHGSARFMATLAGTPKINPASDNSGIRIEYEASVQKDVDEKTNVVLLWTTAIQDARPVMQLSDGDLLYVGAHPNKNMRSWTVDSHLIVTDEKRCIHEGVHKPSTYHRRPVLYRSS